MVQKSENFAELITGDDDDMNKEPRIEWTTEQDAYMKLLVKSNGPHNWGVIADMMNSIFAEKQKNGKQCREHWYNKLDPELVSSLWSPFEEAVLISQHLKHKNSWCSIAEHLRGRNNNAIKNRFYSIFRRVKNRVRSCDLVHSSSLDLVETYYIISVMEESLTKPLTEGSNRRKRGADFLYTLIKDIDAAKLAAYKAQLNKLHPLTKSLEEAAQGVQMELGTVVEANKKVPAAITPGLADTNATTISPYEDMPRLGCDLQPKPVARHVIALPQPTGFSAKRKLTEEEKSFVHQQVFGHVKADLSFPLLPMKQLAGKAKSCSRGTFSSVTAPMTGKKLLAE